MGGACHLPVCSARVSRVWKLTQPTILSSCQERIQALEVELQSVSHSKAMLDKELQEVITQTNRELQEQREKVVQLQNEVGQPHGPGAERLEGQSLACALGRLLQGL